MIHTIYRDDELIIALNGYPYTIDIDNRNWEEINEAIKNKDEATLEVLLTTKGKANQVFADLEKEGIEEDNGDFTYLSNPIPMDLNDYLRASIDDGSHYSIIKFVQRLFENPNHDTRQRLFGFLDYNKMPIDDTGRFLAFKVVNSNYFDKHSGSVYNGIGTKVPVMSWSQVDTNNNVTCSRGYHACSKDYIPAFYHEGDRIVSVAVAPEDVGAIPSDYNNSKLRCRTYEVLADITEQYKKENDSIKLHIKNGVDLYWDHDYWDFDSSSDW